MMKKLLISSLVLATLLFMVSCGGTKKDATSTSGNAVELKLAHTLAVNHPVHLAMQKFSDDVKAKTNGAVNIVIYPSEQLGPERDTLELAQNGAIDFVKTSSGTLESFNKPMSIFSTPYLFRDEAHYFSVLNSDIGDKLLANLESSNLVGLTYYTAGARSFYSSKAINSPSDLVGMKIRVLSSPVAMQMMKDLGGTPTPLSSSEVYTALQTKVADGAENNIPTYVTSRHQEVAKFFTYDEHQMLPDILVASKASWEKLSPEHQAIIKQAAKDSFPEQVKLWNKAVADGTEQAKKDGVTLITPDKKLFVDATQAMRDLVAKDADLGATYQAIISK